MRQLGCGVPNTIFEEKLYGFNDEHESNTLPVHVQHLRRKSLEARAAAEIHSLWGVVPKAAHDGRSAPVAAGKLGVSGSRLWATAIAGLVQTKLRYPAIIATFLQAADLARYVAAHSSALP